VQGQRLQTVADALSFTSSALRTWVYRFAHQGGHGWVERPRSGRPPQVTGALAQPLQRLVDQAPLQHGAIPSQWRCRERATVRAQQTGVHLGRERVRGVLKKERKLLPSHRPTGSHPRRPRVWRSRTGCPRVPGASGRDHCALGRRNDPVALCPAPRGLVAYSAACAPPSTAAEAESKQTGGAPETPDLGALPLLEPHHQRRAALGPRRWAVWHLQRLL
jgi:transposase